MVEEVTGTGLGAYMQANLFEPMGIRDTAYVRTPSMAERACSYHARRPGGRLEPITLEPPQDPELLAPGGGGLASTMPDFGRLMRMFLNDGVLDGERVLEARTVAQMCNNHIGDLRVAVMRSNQPEVSNDAELFPGEEKGWGLGFQVHLQPSANGGPEGMLTWAGLANSYFWIDRTNGIAGAYLSQMLPFADAGSLGLFMEFQREVYRELAGA